MQHLDADTILASAIKVKEGMDLVIMNQYEDWAIRFNGVGVDEPQDLPEPDQEYGDEE